MPTPRFALHLFGPPRLVGPHGPLPSASPRRLAVLAVIAASGQSGIARDRLIGLLWPDADQTRARRNLNQVLYTLRREAQVELTTETAELRLDTDVVSCDLTTFDAAVAARRHEEALATYTGAFLDGFYIPDAAEFDQWVEVERDRRLRQAVAAAEAVATEVEASGRNAASAWRRAAELDPYNGRIATRVVQALANASDRAGALRYGEAHVARLAADLDAPPDAGLQAVLESLRVPMAPLLGTATSPMPIVVPREPIAPSAGAERVPTPPRRPAPEPPPAPAPPAAPRGGFLRRRMPWVIAAGAIVAAGVLAFRPSVPYARGEYIVLGEFANLTGDTLLSRVVMTAFTAALAQSERVAPLPRPRVQQALQRMRRPDTTTLATPELAREVALREHVPLFVTGQLMQVGGELLLQTDIVEAEEGKVLRTQRQRVASRAALLDGIDALARQLRRDLGEARSSVQASPPLPEFTTASLEALRLFAEGKRLERLNRSGEASDRYRAALALDSNFARARTALGWFLAFNNKIAEAEPHLAAAERLAGSLPIGEKLPILASVYRSRGDFDRARLTLKSYLARYPQDAEAWRAYASALRRLDQRQDALAAFDSASRRMPLEAGDYMELAALWGDEARGVSDSARARIAADSVRRQYEHAFELDSTLPTFLYVNHQYGAALVRAGATDSARAVFARMLPRLANDRARGMRSLGYLEAWEGRWRSSARWFADAASTSAGEKQWTSAARNATLAGTVLALAGDTVAARPHLAMAARYSREGQVETRMARYVAVGLLLAGEREQAHELTRWMRQSLVPSFVPGAAAMRQATGMVLVADGRFEPGLDSLRSAAVKDSSTYSRALLALAYTRAGDHAQAAAAWSDLRRRFSFGDEEQFLVQLAPYWEGRAHEATGEAAKARDAYRAFVASFLAVTPAGQLPAAVADAQARLARLGG